MSTALSRPTTITISVRTRRPLESAKGESESYDHLLQDLLEEASYREASYREIERRWKSEGRIPGRRVLRRAGLA